MADEKKDTQKPAVPRAPQGPTKTDTSRIDLADAETPPPQAMADETLDIKEVLKGPTAPPKVAPVKPLTTVVKAIPTAGPKSSTSRISLDAAMSETDSLTEASKDSTVRVDLTSLYNREAAKGGTPSIADAQKNRTARIRIEEPAPPTDTAHIDLAAGDGAPGDTTHLTLGADAKPAADTAHIALGGAASEETSHITLPGGATPPGAPPKTIRLQRPATLPKTVVLSRPDAAAPSVPPPKTVVLKRPGEEGESEKGATSRIAVPEGIVQAGPATQRKTIRIKRPDSAPSSGSKTLVIARPTRAASVSLPASAKDQVEDVVREMQREEGPGALYSVLAIAATLVAAALVYVLAAQTIAPNLPVPGLR